jgi:hypothetical protein
VSRIRKEDLEDLDVIDAVELLSDGAVGVTSPFYGPVAVTSTTSGTKTVVVPLDVGGEGLLDRDHQVKAGDKAVVAGTSGGASDGTFTVATVPTETSFTTVEAIGTSTGGTVVFQHKAGAANVGVDKTGFAVVSHTNVQDALKDLDSAVPSGGSTSNIDFLLENDPPAPANNYDFVKTSGQVTQERWKRVDTTLIKSIDYTYSIGKVSTEVRKVFASDGTTIIGKTTRTWTYPSGQAQYALTRDV